MIKYCDSIRQVVQNARIGAKQLGHKHIGTEHLLLGISMTQSVASRQLAWQGISTQELLGQLASLSPAHRKRRGLSRRAKRVSTIASSPESMLRMLLRDESCGAVALMKCCCIDRDLLFTDLCNYRKEKPMQNTRLLDQFGVDLIERATQPILAREHEIETVLQILSRKQKNNPALIGEPGVGKTAIVEGVAQRIASGRVPDSLRCKRLFSLDMASVIAGTKYRGEFEERIRDILNEVRRVGNIILFIDEIHTIVGAGAAEGAIDAANLFKPALGRGELQLIGATTLKEYRKFIEKDAALERRFRTVQVREPTKEETRYILQGLRSGLEMHHHITITDAAIDAAIEMSCRYLSDKFLPDKAVDLLDEGAAAARMSLPNIDDCMHLECSLREAVGGGDYERAASLRERLQRLRRQPAAIRRVEAQDVAVAVSNRTGIPVGTISVSEKQQLLTLEERLKQRVVGQEQAIRSVCEAVRRGRSGLAEQKRPVATMLFTGPTGVGKTELCKALAETVFGSTDALIRVDMSEYMEKFSVSRLIGAPPGYVGHEEGGELSEKVRRNPYSLVLLDELEKAHRDVCGLLLQIMEDGILTDSLGRKVDFRNTLLVMTSNLGSVYFGRGGLGFGKDAGDATQKALQEHFPPEFLGRIDCIASFRKLDEGDLTKIAAIQLAALQQRARKQQLQLDFAPELAAALAKRSYSGRSGARAIRTLIQNELEAPLAARLLSETPIKNAEIRVDENKICFC